MLRSMRLYRTILPRLYMLLCMLVIRMQAFAQFFGDTEDDESVGRRRRKDDIDTLEDLIDYQPIHISFQDVLTVVFLLVLCYVFGKIWKGCSYLILILAAIFYYLSRF